MSKKYFLIFSITMTIGFVLYITNPSYEQHELIVAEICQAKGSEKNATMCPLGYGKKSASNFQPTLFIVYDAGILSYSTYEKKIATFGILGNVFSSFTMNKV
tara:strand:+ start:1128 stop:1433 length:306 start_codon:yes stop_codon:yes gene_type:complete